MIHIPSAELEVFCQRHHIRKLSFFGSVLREDFRPDSDIDVLVEFEKADLNMPQDLSDFFRDKVLASATVQYGRNNKIRTLK